MPPTTTTAMRAKFVLHMVEQHQHCEVLKFTPVSSDKPYGPNGESEDNTFARYTPSGSCELTVTNPDLLGKLKPGTKYSVDFTPADGAST